MIEQSAVDRFRREIRAAVRAADDPEAFAKVAELHTFLDELLRERAEELRAKDGYSWQDLGRALGVHRSGAQQRWRRKPS